MALEDVPHPPKTRNGNTGWRGPRRTWPQQTIKDALVMRANGYTYREIGKAVQAPWPTVQAWCRADIRKRAQQSVDAFINT